MSDSKNTLTVLYIMQTIIVLLILMYLLFHVLSSKTPTQASNPVLSSQFVQQVPMEQKPVTLSLQQTFPSHNGSEQPSLIAKSPN